MIGLPKLTKEGYRILCYRLSDYDPSKMNFGEAVKAFCMFNDVIISEDGPMEGYIVVFDMKGVRLGHLTRVQFGALRIFMAYIQVTVQITSNRMLIMLSLFVRMLIQFGSRKSILFIPLHSSTKLWL